MIKKHIFSYINDKSKLILVKYNKLLQNSLDINIDNYKIFSGKKIELEKEGKVKIYDCYNDNTLLYEGEYPNGKGKEYNYYGELIFEGEYLNRKKWKGKGKEYHDNNELKFEGEYLNGEKYGKGKGYNYYGNLIFEGEYLNGKRNKKGKEYYIIINTN